MVTAFVRHIVDFLDHFSDFPLYFALHLASFFGFHFSDEYSEQTPFLDLQEGMFVAEHPIHPYFLSGQYSYITSQLLKTMQPNELGEIKLNQDIRSTLLYAYQSYYALHITDFGVLKTLPVLQKEQMPLTVAKSFMSAR
jgi:DNA repair protein RecO (recombination protein O)